MTLPEVAVIITFEVPGGVAVICSGKQPVSAPVKAASTASDPTMRSAISRLRRRPKIAPKGSSSAERMPTPRGDLNTATAEPPDLA